MYYANKTLLCLPGYWKRKDYQKRQQQSLWKVYSDWLQPTLPHHWGQHENISVGEVSGCFSGLYDLSAFFWKRQTRQISCPSQSHCEQEMSDFVLISLRPKKREIIISSTSSVPPPVYQSLKTWASVSPPVSGLRSS